MLNLGFLDLLVPVIVQVIALIYLPITLFILVKNREFPTLRSWTAFQQAWFARFWMFFGRASRPLFAADVEHVLSRARGVVLDLGTGSGDWAYMFATARNQHITKILFLEPNTQFHPKLRKMAQSVGLDGRYEILGGGVEELDHRGVKKGTVDTVVTVHVLCSVSSPEPLVKELYEYLRPGGQWLVYEHVKVREGDSVASTCQDTINFVWPILFDGCSLTRDTKHLLLRTGKWQVADLGPGSNEGPFNMLPHIRGALTKAE